MTQEINLGSKCVMGVEKSLGDIITFLEDDDIFFSGKLEKIKRLFESTKGLVYYHNNYSTIDQRGNNLEIELFNPIKSPILFDLDQINEVQMVNILRKGSFFNLSCISIRKDVLLPWLERLKQISVAVDNFMFYISLSSNSKLFLDDEILTGYTIHEENDSIHVGGSLQSIMIKRQSFLERDIEGYEIIINSVKNQLLLDTLRYRILAPRINLYIIDPSKVKISKSECVDGMKYSIRTHYWLLFFLCLFHLFFEKFHKLSIKIYSFYIMREVKNLHK